MEKKHKVHKQIRKHPRSIKQFRHSIYYFYILQRIYVFQFRSMTHSSIRVICWCRNESLQGHRCFANVFDIAFFIQLSWILKFFSNIYFNLLKHLRKLFFLYMTCIQDTVLNLTVRYKEIYHRNVWLLLYVWLLYVRNGGYMVINIK